ncbi:MAG: di-heme oxidoredictase family protein [Limnohabitans sp.]|nr:di-heme oxidoredictase family protein [Limnohabitans sp.]
MKPTSPSFNASNAIPSSAHGVLAAILAATATATTLAGGVTLQPKAGDPLLGLSKVQAARWTAGRISYITPFGNATGLGPIFNKSNCQSCHSNPVGGWGSISVTRFGIDEKGEFFPLEELGGSLLQSFAISDPCRETIPSEATVQAVRMTNSSMAFGLIEAIPDASIAANEDPADANADGVSGRVHWVLPLEASPASPLRAGRFGWKAQIATVLSFSGDATAMEMGITNALIPNENAPNGDMALLTSCDTVADPEDVPDASGFTFIERVTHFQRYLAQPPQTPRSGMSGEAVFNAIGCNACHVRDWTTSNSPALETAIRNKAIRPYSDFLLHDMGTLGDGVQDGDANELEMRTPTLWNLRTRDPMLHNGSASGGTFEDRVTIAINAHGPFGEGANSAAAFAALSANDKAKLIAFLDSLGRNEFDINGDRFVTLEDFAIFVACQGASIGADSPCAIGDIDQNGVINANDMAGFLLAAQRDGFDILDCDNDGTPDLTEIFNGAPDKNLDGVPDDCGGCVGDLDGDGFVAASDLATLLGGWGGAEFDLDGDGSTGASDLATLLSSWGPCQ